MKTKHFAFWLIALLMSYGVNAQHTPASNDTLWLSLEKAHEAFMKNPRPILINFYDSSADSCKIMFDSVYSDPIVRSYMYFSFYCVNVDVNDTRTLKFFDGTEFAPGKDGKRHGLAEHLIPNLKLPAILVFNLQGEGSAFNGSFDQHKMLAYLLYYSERGQKTNNFDDFYSNFTKAFPKDRGRGFNVISEKVKWLSMEEALKLNAEKPKMIFLDIYANWKNVCTMMLVSTYAADSVADLLNNQFYPVRIEATTRDTLNVYGGTYLNPSTDPKQKMVHQFVQALLQNSLQFPSILFFDDKSKLIGVHQNYFAPTSMFYLLTYYTEPGARNQKFSDYLNTKLKRK